MRPAAKHSTPSTDTDPPATTPAVAAQQAARALAEATGSQTHDVAVVLGSGWRRAADVVGADTTTIEIPTSDLPGFSRPGVAGHAGTVRSLTLGGVRCLLMLGRTHLYEGNGVAAVAHGVRTAAAAGARAVVLTNGCGGLRPEHAPGSAVLISDHLNLTATSPLQGAEFVDLTDVYSSRLRALAREVDADLLEGVYAGLPGPHYETPAEIRMLQTMGADLVGMSTVLEAIAARAAGLEVLGISLVTNLGAGLGSEPLDHAEVLAAGRQADQRIGTLLRGILERM